MRQPSCLSPPRRTRPPQVGLRWLIAAVSLVSILLALGLYLWVLLLLATALFVITCHGVAALLAARLLPDRRPHSPAIPRCWHRLGSSPGAWPSTPIVVALVHTGLFVIWHLFMFITWRDMSMFFDTAIATGITLRGLDHATNVAVLAYLLAHVTAGLFPYSDRPRHERSHLALLASLVATLHFAIP